MKTVAVLFGIAQCLAVIAPTHAAPNPEHEHHNKGLRNRLKRQYSGDYGYGHHPQWPRHHFEPRRDDTQDLLSKVYRLLEELTDLQRRPPPPPQPIYIPYPVAYPVQYPVPVYRNCQGANPKQNLTFPIRFPSMEDINQNWGYDLSQELPEDYSKNTRPINFDRVTPPTYTTRPPPKFDHGTSQADNDKSPREGSARRPKKCDAMVLSCCNPNETRQQQHRCFTLEGCGEYFEQNDVCSTGNLQEVLDLFASVYSPKN